MKTQNLHDQIRSNFTRMHFVFHAKLFKNLEFLRMDGNPAKSLDAYELIKRVEKKGKITKSAAIDISNEVRDSNLTITL